MPEAGSPKPPIRVLVIDDSAQNRRTLTELLSGQMDILVVGHASDGDEGLKAVNALRPDVITLDLEMPRLDGFTFLRLLMATQPTPVIVVSSYAHRADVFQALSLGALDFLGKPTGGQGQPLETLREELVEKVRAVRALKAMPAARKWPIPPDPRVVGLGASTGGPSAIERTLKALDPRTRLCLLVAQHMPAGFTQAFAERLDRLLPLTVREARMGELLLPGQVLIGPGGRQLGVRRGPRGLEAVVNEPAGTDRHAPSVNHLFASLAQTLGRSALGVVLTGMGDDGAQGTVALADAGGEVWAESAESSLIFGMPAAALETGRVLRAIHLDNLAAALERWSVGSADG